LLEKEDIKMGLMGFDVLYECLKKAGVSIGNDDL
jgi:hypothetical protein